MNPSRPSEGSPVRAWPRPTNRSVRSSGSGMGQSVWMWQRLLPEGLAEVHRPQPGIVTNPLRSEWYLSIRVWQGSIPHKLTGVHPSRPGRGWTLSTTGNHYETNNRCSDPVQRQPICSCDAVLDLWSPLQPTSLRRRTIGVIRVCSVAGGEHYGEGKKKEHEDRLCALLWPISCAV